MEEKLECRRTGSSSSYHKSCRFWIDFQRRGLYRSAPTRCQLESSSGRRRANNYSNCGGYRASRRKRQTAGRDREAACGYAADRAKGGRGALVVQTRGPETSGRDDRSPKAIRRGEPNLVALTYRLKAKTYLPNSPDYEKERRDHLRAETGEAVGARGSQASPGRT